ncbi:hypothetical protein Tco_0285151 [Tanacetum coccineum]
MPLISSLLPFMVGGVGGRLVMLVSLGGRLFELMLIGLSRFRYLLAVFGLDKLQVKQELKWVGLGLKSGCLGAEMGAENGGFGLLDIRTEVRGVIGIEDREVTRYKAKLEDRARREEELFTHAPLLSVENKKLKHMRKSRFWLGKQELNFHKSPFYGAQSSLNHSLSYWKSWTGGLGNALGVMGTKKTTIEQKLIMTCDLSHRFLNRAKKGSRDDNITSGRKVIWTVTLYRQCGDAFFFNLILRKVTIMAKQDNIFSRPPWWEVQSFLVGKRGTSCSTSNQL